jgi:multicomponent K+:H+ antiporter subunit F
MLDLAVALSFGMLGVALLLNLWRLVRGPELPDRVLALDTLYVNAIGLILLLDVHLDRAVNFEAALVIAMMGFVGTLAFSKFLLRGDIIE